MEEHLLDLVREQLPRVSADIERLLADSVRIRTRPVDPTSLNVGASKLGGTPDLPLGTKWPEHNGAPLAFIAQLNIPDLTTFDVARALPASGMLYFFYAAADQPWGFDPNDRGSWRVLYHDVDLSRLVRTGAPAALPDDQVFTTCATEFTSDITLPGPESYLIHQLMLNEEERSRYYDIIDELSTLHELDGTIHRILGHPDAIQGDMLLECQLVSHGLYCGNASGYNDPRSRALEEGAKDWRLLLQIDSDEGAGMMWGDVGRIFYFVRQDALKERDFSTAWLVLQCS